MPLKLPLNQVKFKYQVRTVRCTLKGKTSLKFCGRKRPQKRFSRDVTYSCWGWRVTELQWRENIQAWSKQHHQLEVQDAGRTSPSLHYCSLAWRRVPSALDGWTGRSEHSDWSPTGSSSDSDWVPADSAAAGDPPTNLPIKFHVNSTTKWLPLLHILTSLLQWISRFLTLYRMVMPIGTPFLKEKINN